MLFRSRSPRMATILRAPTIRRLELWLSGQRRRSVWPTTTGSRFAFPRTPKNLQVPRDPSTRLRRDVPIFWELHSWEEGAFEAKLRILALFPRRGAFTERQLHLEYDNSSDLPPFTLPLSLGANLCMTSSFRMAHNTVIPVKPATVFDWCCVPACATVPRSNYVSATD